MRAVNLLPREGQREKRKPQTLQMGAVVGVVVVTGLLCASFLSKTSAVAQERTNLDLAHKELASIPPPAAVHSAEPQLAETRNARLTAVASALDRRVPWDRLLRQFSLVLPEDVWLTTLSARSPVAAVIDPVTALPGAAPDTFVFSGYSYSHESVARLLARLAVVPDLTNVQLQRSALTSVAGRQIVQFTIVAALRFGGGTA